VSEKVSRTAILNIWTMWSNIILPARPILWLNLISVSSANELKSWYDLYDSRVYIINNTLTLKLYRIK
jgi:hypothetical protein